MASRRIALHFTDASREASTHSNLSAVRHDGDHLWVAGDETSTVERLSARGGRPTQAYGEQLSFDLAELVDLPAGAGAEADIEGIARSGGWLWAVGSHSLKRKRVRSQDSDKKARKRLATVQREENRYVVVRMPVVAGEDGPAPVRDAPDPDGGPALTAAVLGGSGGSLADLLADDPHVGPFVSIPSKDNGLDIEGIAAHGDRLYVGLRGPVLRGWAVLVEIRPETHPRDPHRLRLAPVGEDGEAYRTHLLDLGGLGVRDICPQGDDLLLLAGPSMGLDGPVRVHRWPGACLVDAADVVRARELPRVLDLPYGEGDDHAEGIALLPGETELLVVYDSPSPERREGDAVLADAVALP